MPSVDVTSSRPVFIVGMERSGTSLLRRIFNASEELAVAPELHFVNRWLGRWEHGDAGDQVVFDQFWEAFSTSTHFAKLGLDADEVSGALRRSGVETWRDVHVGLLTAFSSAHGKVRIGEKVPAYFRHLETLLCWYPDCRIVYSVREPRAVVASHRALEEPWARGSVYELSRKWRERASTALRWSSHPQVRLVRYEDLVADVHGTVDSLCRFVGVATAPDVDVMRSQVDAWRDRLSLREAEIVLHVTRRAAAELGYPTDPIGGVTIRARVTGQAVSFATRAIGRRLRSH